MPRYRVCSELDSEGDRPGILRDLSAWMRDASSTSISSCSRGEDGSLGLP